MSEFISYRTVMSIRTSMLQRTEHIVGSCKDSSLAELLKDSLQAEIKQIISGNPTLGTHVTTSELIKIEDSITQFAQSIEPGQDTGHIETDPNFCLMVSTVTNVLSAVSKQSIEQGINFGSIVAIIIFFLVCFFIFAIGGIKAVLRPHLFIAGLILAIALTGIRNL